MHKTMRVAAVLAALTMMSVPAFAQAGGGRPGGGGGGGFGGGQFGRPGGGDLTVVQIPVAVLTPALKLTADQSSKIKGMQDKLDAARKAARPAGFGGGAGGAGGGGFDREAMQAMMEEMRAKQEQIRNEETKASKAIDAMLTPDQSAALKAAMPGWKVMQQFGLLQYAADLNLTPAQMAVLEKAAKERAAQMQGGGRRGGGN
ncbi:Spy/CpxP family protein refolding chaperone [Armatimonas sp.]|uniref:Spy/CpxP family protein refolding chaperone n=1 Tax=Armatimonas sp. TaxID=1872638 RepID=UPI00286C21B8|nr:Spy/CpxP family protein refolding chaperone [Armatimonas sp.]